jgi:hypothetical protein
MNFYSVYAQKPLPGGLVAEVVLLTFGRARLILSEAGALTLLDGW